MANINWKTAKALVARAANGAYQYLVMDLMTNWLVTIGGDHHEIHEGRSFTAEYTFTTDGTDNHRSGIYFKTGPTGGRLIHATFTFSASAAAEFFIEEAPLMVLDGGTSKVVQNRWRDSTKTSTVSDNADAPAVGYYSTLTETQMAATLSQSGTQLRYGALAAGTGPKVAGGVSRGTQEWILAGNTGYIAYVQSVGANVNIQNTQIDWYESTNKGQAIG